MQALHVLIPACHGPIENAILVSQVLDNSYPKENIIHFMLPKDKLLSLDQQVGNESGSSGELMTFSVRPSTAMSGITTNMTSIGGMS